MAKSLIINGLTRTGSTMLERLIDSQDDMICAGGLFRMPAVIAYLRNLPLKGAVELEDFSTGPNRLTEQSYDKLRSALVSIFFESLASSLASGYGPREDAANAVFGLSLKEILAAADVILNYETPSDLGGVMHAIATRLGLSLIAGKWTQCHRYAPVFLESPHAYWIEIIRNPYARMTSALRRGAAELDHVALPITQDGMRFASQFRHERYYVLRYEKLCEAPEETLAELSRWLGLRIENRDLVNPLGGAFHAQTSDNVDQDRPYYFQDDTILPRIGALDDDRWRKHLAPVDKELINIALDFCNLYEKEYGSTSDRLRAFVRYAKIRARGGARGLVNGLTGLSGFQLVRRPDVSL